MNNRLDLSLMPVVELKNIIASSKTKSEVLRAFELPGRSDKHLTLLNELIEKYSISIAHFNNYFQFDLELLRNSVESSSCIKEVAIKLGKAKEKKPLSSKWYKRIRQLISDNKIDCSHFSSAHAKLTSEYRNKRYENNEIFKNGSDISSQTLKKRYCKIRKKDYECDICGISEWNKMPIVLQLDHIDGNSHNNEVANLRLICPNCHSQTPTFCGKSLRKKGKSRQEDIKFKNKILEKGECQKHIELKPSKNRIKTERELERARLFQERALRDIESRKSLILNSGIDLTEFGRGKKIAELLGIKGASLNRWLKKHMPEQYILLKHKNIRH